MPLIVLRPDFHLIPWAWCDIIPWAIIVAVGSIQRGGRVTVSAIEEGSDGTMWFATANGLSAFAREHWRLHTREEAPAGGAQFIPGWPSDWFVRRPFALLI